MASLVMRIKESDSCVPIVTNAHQIAKSHTSGGILLAIEDVIDRAET